MGKIRGVAARIRSAVRLFALAALALALPAAPAGAQSYVSIDEARGLGVPVDDSIQGFLEAVESFSFVNLDPNLQAQSGAGAGFPSFREFADEARQTIDAVPFPSGSTSVTYTWNPNLDVFERWEQPLAPALSQNARTNGARRLTIGTAYSYVDYSHFNDEDLRRTTFSAGDIPVVFGDGSVGRARDIMLSDFSLKEHVYTISFQYGVLDNLDVGVFVPVIDMSFRGKSIDRFFLETADGTLRPADVSLDENGQCCLFTSQEGAPEYRSVKDVDGRAYQGLAYPGISHREDEVGVGDMIVRAKYFIGSYRTLDAGILFNSFVPTGDEDDLFGVGSVRFQPRLIVSSSQGRFAFHTNLGYHADVDEGDRNRFDYSAGAEFRVFEKLTLLLDQIGRVGIQGDHQVRKFEIVPGVKVNPWRDIVVGFNAIVPLNREGLTTDWTPNAIADVSMRF